MIGMIQRCLNGLSADHVFLEFVDHPKMKPIKDRTVWIHINIPGQGTGAADLPPELVSITSHLQQLKYRRLEPDCPSALQQRAQELSSNILYE